MLGEPVEERGNPRLRRRALSELGAAEAIDLVAPQLQFAVLSDHLGVPLRVGTPGLVGVVLLAVALDHDADSLWQE